MIYKEVTNMTIGDFVKIYREENDMSMEEFAKLCGVSKGYISMLENNTNPRNLDVFQKPYTLSISRH